MAQTFKLVKGMDRVDPKVQERDGERTQVDRDGTNLRENTEGLISERIALL